jgi:hypothetical protein
MRNLLHELLSFFFGNQLEEPTTHHFVCGNHEQIAIADLAIIYLI